MKYSKIIISGKRCSGKTTLLWDLQKEVTWPMFSIGQYLRDYIHRYNLTPEQIEEQSAKVSYDLDDRIEALLNGPDHVIVDARIYGRFRTIPEDTCSLLLTCDDRVRVQRAAYREKTSVEKQEHRLIKRENAWIERMNKLYDIDDFFKPSYYTAHIDTTGLAADEVLRQTMSILSP